MADSVYVEHSLINFSNVWISCGLSDMRASVRKAQELGQERSNCDEENEPGL
jgi:hypothetical protein